MELIYTGRSDTGRVRSANQDNFAVERLGTGSLIAVVCDGMGGARGGNIASSLAAETFIERVKKLASKISSDSLRLTPESACRILDDAIHAANHAVYKKSQGSADLRGMGTTLVAALFCGSTVYVANVGDSRLYLLSESDITQITHDHSYVQHLIDSGSLTPEEARSHPYRNRITRAVGIGSELEADIFSVELDGLDDCYLLISSDGLHGLLTARELHELVLTGVKNPLPEHHFTGDAILDADTKELDPLPLPEEDKPETESEPLPPPETEEELAERVKRLISAANDAGGPDNITAVLIRYTDR